MNGEKVFELFDSMVLYGWGVCAIGKGEGEGRFVPRHIVSNTLSHGPATTMLSKLFK